MRPRHGHLQRTGAGIEGKTARSIGTLLDLFMNTMKPVLLEIKGLIKHFNVQQGLLSGRRAAVKALNGVDLKIYRGETLGIVGESGCGKSTLGRLIMRLDDPTGGEILFEGEDILSYSGNVLKNYRKKVQIIFQDPYASLNPRRTAGSTVGEPLMIYDVGERKGRGERVARLMEQVGLSREQMNRYPHEFSGGQRQRIGIARAIALNPALIIADEPVSALDVSIQAQILNLLKDLQREYGLTYLFITHDLSVVRHMSDRIAVMYMGKIVELARNHDLYEHPFHPYTMALLSAVPVPEPGRKKERMILDGDLPSAVNLPAGCTFHPRCPFRMDVCDHVTPALNDRGGGHLAACHMEGYAGSAVSIMKQN
jgi:oligopeptide/dipeptide ABC transporter ATP-binding protein